ncbi:D-alanine--D-alanine ligase [Rathayibacter sp. YIM 133350]|uniref:D-alanine--D-alanine ligase family protein n=1 Tax=Rathayibacter sp. YIM 133350 TaxID=3131992 RepID=UPI00307E69A8
MTAPSLLDIVVLAGGISHEREVSLRSGRRVADALSARGHRVRIVDPDSSLFSGLSEHRPDVIWPVLHGSTGEDGALLSLLETTGIPFVGARGDDAGLAWLKPVAKALVRRAGIATPDSITLGRETFRDLGAADVLARVLEVLPVPVVVKPSEGGSAQGVSIVRDATELPRAMVEAYSYSEIAVIERLVEGTEVAIGVVDTGDGPYALPAVEIEPLGEVYSFDARYNAGETLFYTPARVTAEVATTLADTAVRVHELLQLRHLSRIDLIIDESGVAWFLEANVLPGLTETSLVPQAIEAAGSTLDELYSAIAVAAASGAVK